MHAALGASSEPNGDQDLGAFGGRVLIADNSVWQRTHRLPAGLREEWLSALRGDQIATVAVVKLEVLYSARSAVEFDQLQEELDALRDVPINQGVGRTALFAIREIAHSAQPCRISPPDALIAAAAHHAPGVGVLHYDRHYDRLAGVLTFDSCWIAPPGTIA